ncbi:geranylgeranyl reductase/geranylgeranyl reductase family [Congregibacter litoralis KT71]|uniref:Protein CbrA n=2 Tax=Congregibacter TaxID=393661 RepID=A4ACN7_9GAMM|nr:geranylgeranyl reductase/geranylgeranyl reductase family [Congregibacter litoralis KT71]
MHDESSMNSLPEYDVVVVGGGPAGATAAYDLSKSGKKVLLIERGFRIKPCGGAIPPRAVEQFNIPAEQIVARIRSARMISPADQRVDMPVGDTYVAMVDRDKFDPFLRERAVEAGATLQIGAYKSLFYQDDGRVRLRYLDKSGSGGEHEVIARAVIGADGAKSRVGAQCIPGGDKLKCVFAYHEIVEAPTPEQGADYQETRCDVWYQGRLSPDFYAWVFPHGKHASIGTGSAQKNYSATAAVEMLRKDVGLDTAKTVRREGAPIPMKPLKRWDDGRAVLLAGDSAGVVAPASGEGIYYALLGGRLAADAVEAFLLSHDPAALKTARKRFMKLHGKVFFVLGLLQRFWYGSDKRREKFVKMCRDPDIQYLTWQSYTQKELVRERPTAHVKIFFKDLAELLGLARA